MSHTLATNPAVALSESKKAMVDAVETRLFARIDDTVPGLSAAVRRVRDERTAAPVSTIGRLWPWVLADLAGVDDTRIDDIGEAWLALYMYTLIVDKHCDEPARPEPAEILAASVLFEMGLADLWSLTAGTPWAGAIRDAIHESFRSQSRDVALRSSFKHLAAKREASAKKNSGFVVGAALFVSLGSVDPGALVTFARSVLLALQHLDDLADFADDYNGSNYTPLLTGAAEWLEARGDILVNRDELTLALVASGSLSAVLNEVRNVLATSNAEVLRAYATTHRASASTVFFGDLQQAIETTAAVVRDAERQLDGRALDVVKRKRLARRIQRQLVIVAQSS